MKKTALIITLFLSVINSSQVRAEIVTVNKRVLDNFLEQKPSALLDIHGIDYKKHEVTLKSDNIFMKHLQDNNINYLTRFNLDSRANLADYKKPNEVVDAIRSYAAEYPAITKLINVGRTHQGRTIMGIEITEDFEVDKPVISFNGMHHARELMTVEMNLSIIEKLLDQYTEGDPEVKSFLKDFKFIIVPQVNPDGSAVVHRGDIWWRKNAWKNQAGRVVGVDLNRNYPTDWNFCNGSSGRTRAQDYRGENPASEPETRAMLKLFETYMPIANISYHSYSELIIYPFGCSRSKNTATELFHKIANDMKRVITDDRGYQNTFRVGTAPRLLYQADGTDLDTHWKEFGTISYTIELNSSSQGFHPAYQKWRDKTVNNQEQGWKELIRSAKASAVKFTAMENYSYVIRNDRGESFAGIMGPSSYKARRNRLEYKILLPGRYVLDLMLDDKIIKQKSFTLSKGVIDLGHL